MDGSDPEIPLRDKLRGLFRVAAYRPKIAGAIICLNIFAAMLEGIGLSFLFPIIKIAQGDAAGETSGIEQAFVSVYDFLGLPFVLETVIVGVAVVMVVRFTSSFVVGWLQAILRTDYQRHLQTEGFRSAISAQISYYDEHGSDEILNAIVTQAEYASNTIVHGVRMTKQTLLSLIYLAVALLLVPWLTVLMGGVLAAILYGLRWAIESGYSVGDRVAEGNERVHEAVQAGTQGIRDVKLFSLTDELFNDFQVALKQFTDSHIRLRRNQVMLDNFSQMMAAISVFGLIYFALSFFSLSLASLGVFLFAMFRLAPRVSQLNDNVYQLEGSLPHLVRMQRFIDELEEREEADGGGESPPDPVRRVAFDDVVFSYGDEVVLDGLSFEVERGEFIAFIGQSGAGKSTIVSLLARMYEPDSGEITADGTPIDQFVLREWRERLSVVRQDPHIFNDTLRYNVTVGNRDATEEEILQACEIAEVTEFMYDLPHGLDTVLGDNGVRLSGGQRQRVSLARALLKDGDLLVLDEATSDLDSGIEDRVQRGIERVDRDFAVIIIAHRLSTIVNADRIYSMEDGQIHEVGQHQDLLERDGIYATLYRKQT